MDSLLINSLKREGFVSYGLMEGGFVHLMTCDARNPGGGARQSKVRLQRDSIISVASRRWESPHFTAPERCTDRPATG